MKTVRVFPRRTKATPVDDMAYVGLPDMFVEADRVDISVAFTWDIPRAEWLAKQWEKVAPVEIGGPAISPSTGEFVPGRYLREGYVITSRGCPNKCWFCSAWKSGFQELPIRDGWNVLDDNLLACSEGHIRAVFAMLARQGQRVAFTGGLEADKLEDWHVGLLASLNAKPSLFFAYDEDRDWEPLLEASRKVFAAGFTQASHCVRCYVLIGYPGDSLDNAESRLQGVVDLGITPMAMLYRDRKGLLPPKEWRVFQRRWARPAIIHAKTS